LTEKELREIEARAAEATLGPWRAEFGSEVKSGKDVIAYIRPRVGGWADTLFMAAARSDIPALCAEVRRLQKVIDGALKMLGMSPVYQAQESVGTDREGKGEKNG